MGNPVKLRSLITALQGHSDGTYTVTMRPEGRIPKFKPGQFLHLAIDDFDPNGGFWPESRVFSIASRSGQQEITIAYSVKGSYTARMASYLAPGKKVWIKLPFGNFVIDSRFEDGCAIVLIAGGTGISPFIPFLEGMNQGKISGQQVRLYYGARKPEYILFQDVLGRCVADGSLDFRIWIEAAESEMQSIAGVLAKSGKLHIDEIIKESSDLCSPTYFLSGPPMMVLIFRSALVENGTDTKKVQIDEWE
jgi:NAD(P)H-flavin reductase